MILSKREDRSFPEREDLPFLEVTAETSLWCELASYASKIDITSLLASWLATIKLKQYKGKPDTFFTVWHSLLYSLNQSTIISCSYS